jgi:uncharacterized protein
MDKSERIELRVKPETKKRAEAIARKAGVSLSSLIQAYLASLTEEGVSTKPGILSFDEIYDAVNVVLRSFAADKVQKAYLFGSYARGEASGTSDVDILIEPGKKMTLLDLGKINGELNEKLGKNVDTIASIESLDLRMVDGVLRDRKILYEAKASPTKKSKSI